MTNDEKLIKLLAELFQFDQADLDFGIYRIMNQKRDEITCFLEKDLLPQVQESFRIYQNSDKAGIQEELNEAIKQANALGADPDTLPKVKELRKKLAASVDITAMENEVYSDLFNFFRRYYSEGDFLSLRRYKEGVYAIPYEGEEVKLHWANHDQYYIKTSEYLRDYTFKVPFGRRVHFKLVEADSEKDNQKAQAGKERRFILCKENPVLDENGELFMRFEFLPDPEKRKQTVLNEQAVQTIFNTKGIDEWLGASGLTHLSPTPKNPRRTLLEKRLTDYTARNTFDYFIHKDLGGFLRRELDFYIKNEVMHLDDIENETVAHVERYLSKIKVIRKIAHKIIAFLEQLENFQKKLWLKKKFVVETNYCVTLDRVPEELYPEIVANHAQRGEWVQLFAIDEIRRGIINPGYSNPLTAEFLKAEQYLVLDTCFFDESFKARLLASIENFDEQCDGLLIHSENFQALNLLQERYREQVKCIYIDPPYNTGEDGFIYKDGYPDSTWLCCLDNRLAELPSFMQEGSSLWINIDDNEAHNLKVLCDCIYGKSSFIAANIWQKRYSRENREAIGDVHDYIFTYSLTPLIFKEQRNKILLTDKQAKIYTNPNNDPKGRWRSIPLTAQAGHATKDQFYEIKAPGGNIFTPPQGRCWGIAEKTFKKYRDEGRIYFGKDGNSQPNLIRYLSEVDGITPWTWWPHEEVGNTDESKKELYAILGKETGFDTPKPSRLLKRIVHISTEKRSLVLDYFAGSGTTGHAVISLNRKDDGKRKYILVEMGEYFDTVLKPRIQKVVYSHDWKDGKPVSRKGSSHMFKYIRLESYEDTLNNLELSRTKKQQLILEQHPSVREEYILSYMLDVESSHSASLLNIASFENPFAYKLNISTSNVGETKPVAVDLVETFNYLLGLTVQHIDHIRDFRVVQGSNPKGEKVLVLWRNLKEKSNEDLDEFFQKQGYNTKDREFDLIYVNGDNNLENLKRPVDTWKVRLIEEDFKRLMFDVEDV